MDIFKLPAELLCAILASAATPRPQDCSFNTLALVGRSWHAVLAPPTGECIAALTRRGTLTEQDLLLVAHIVRPWWRHVKGRDVTAAGLANLAISCTAITHLDLSWCYGVTDEGVANLATGCTSITTLKLFQCNRITDAGLARLATGCVAITTLDLCHCVQITDLASLATRCNSITKLNICRTMITDKALASLATGCATITGLNLSVCKQITDAGLASLAAGCTALSTLVLAVRSSIRCRPCKSCQRMPCT
jgi:hypothetical protein